ncbi:MAG: cytochrome c-type biogenesis protein CcmH [Rhizobiaceae bacterium]|nr:cytochrome c-type biogenesis protein CcmH [Rhizobiaceae bacterium]
MLRRFVATCLLFVWLMPAASTSALAQTTLSPEMEVRAKALFLQLRCVVCQNQSIGDSDADVAKDLREIVREQMLAGKTDDDIRNFLVARYGEFILLKPVFAWHTAVLWLTPILLLLVGGVLAWRATSRSPKSVKSDALSKQDENELQEILRQHRD